MTELPREPYTAGKPAGDGLLQVDTIARKVGISAAWLKDHIEEFAAAYLKHTNLPPDQARMFVAISLEGLTVKQVVWFENKAEADRDALMAMLHRLEWVDKEDEYGGVHTECPVCHVWQFRGGHKPGCELEQVLKAGGEG